MSDADALRDRVLGKPPSVNETVFLVCTSIIWLLKLAGTSILIVVDCYLDRSGCSYRFRGIASMDKAEVPWTIPARWCVCRIRIMFTDRICGHVHLDCAVFISTRAGQLRYRTNANGNRLGSIHRGIKSLFASSVRIDFGLLDVFVDSEGILFKSFLSPEQWTQGR